MGGRGLPDRWTPRAWLSAAPTTALWPCRIRGAQALADAQLQADWPQLLQEPLCQAHPLHSEILSPLPALHYYWTMTQSEYATDVIFKKPEALQRHYPAFVHHALRNFQSLDVMRFLGRALTVIRSPLMGATWSLRSLLRNTPTLKNLPL